MQEATTSAALRQNNRRRIYRYIYDSSEPVTKQDVARSLELSMPTVSSNITDLMDEGLISYTGTLASTGGRKPRTISLVSDVRFSMGLSIMDDAVRLTAVDLKAQELAYQKVGMKFNHPKPTTVGLRRWWRHFSMRIIWIGAKCWGLELLCLVL